MKQLILTLVIVGFSFTEAMASKISGKVTDSGNSPLPFLTVFVEGTTNGTTTNSNGDYFLNLPNGKYTLVYRFVGFRTVKKEVDLENGNLVLNIRMEEEITKLKEVSISANAEDPAYEMIRQAQAKREFYEKQLKEYSCNVYIKGLQRITKAPKKILGVDITLPGVEKDSANSGIIYLSESISEFSYQAPSKKKERMISSKTSGNNNGFSWNSALDFNLDFYQPSMELDGLSERNFISPIAPMAMVYYDYEFVGDFTDGEVLVNKIRVIPKRKGLPAYSGFIYIQENSWRIHSTELFITKEFQNVDFVDTLKVKQVYIPVSEEVWVIGTQTFDFQFSLDLFKIKGAGYYLGIFSDYNLQPNFPPKHFGAEISKIEADANKKDSVYWEEIRPVKLTGVEVTDYYKKDSIAVVRKSEVYLDSVDSVRNKPKPINLLTGYTFRKSYKNINFSIPSILENIQFNAVEGYNLNLVLKASRYNREKNNYISFEQQFRYGFDSEKLYYKSLFYRRFNGINRRRIQVEGGKYVQQFNENEPISPFLNTIYATLREENYLKLFEKTYAKIGFGQELVNGVFFTTSLEFAKRTPLVNNQISDFARRDIDDKEFESNNPIQPNDFTQFFEEHNAFIWDLHLRIKFKQKYYTRPNRKFSQGSKFPTLDIFYQKGIEGVGNSITDFDFLKVSVFDKIKLGLFGNSQFNISYGGFLSKKNMPFMDSKHFMTTEILFSNNTLNSFFNLPYYQFSTTENFLEAHYEHHFAGLFFQKIPAIRKLKWQVVAGSHLLYTESNKEYLEVTAGIENIFKIARVDWALSMPNGGGNEHSVRLRIGF
jgi:hypothetical protein